MKIIIELLWLVIAFILAFIIQEPILKEIDYKFIYINTSVIVFLVLYIRFLLNFKNTIGLLNKWIKYIIFSFNFFLIVVLVLKIQKMTQLHDIFAIELYQNTIKILDIDKKSSLMNYINFEFLLSSTSLLASTLLLSIRILKSFWTKKSIKDY